MKLSDLLAEYKQREKITIGEMATMFGVKKSVLEQWLYGNHLPRLEQFPAIASALGMTTDDLFRAMGLLPGDFAEARSLLPADPFVQRLQAISLSARDKRIVLGIARRLARQEG